jgi:hypothetical protein
VSNLDDDCCDYDSEVLNPDENWESETAKERKNGTRKRIQSMKIASSGAKEWEQTTHCICRLSRKPRFSLGWTLHYFLVLAFGSDCILLRNPNSSIPNWGDATVRILGFFRWILKPFLFSFVQL